MNVVTGTLVDIATADGAADAYLTHPDDGQAHPGVLLYQDAFGVRPHLTAMADRPAAAGYTVLPRTSSTGTGASRSWSCPNSSTWRHGRTSWGRSFR